MERRAHLNKVNGTKHEPMRLRQIIAGMAGVLVSFLVPLPQPETVSGAPVKLAGSGSQRMPRSVSAVAERDWPTDVASIATMSANECSAALDRILRHCACALPDGETMDAAVALTIRLTDLGAAKNPERNPLQGRHLPVWLLQKAMGSTLQRSPVPPPGLMAAVAQSAEGREAMMNLTVELAAASSDKAKALAAACPAPWRPALSVKAREGLAVRDPVAAAREAWEAASPQGETDRPKILTETNMWEFVPPSGTKPDDRLETLMMASRKGPVKEAVTALALYGDGGADEKEQQQMLATLLQRDAAATRAAVEECGDPVMQAHLTAAEQMRPPAMEKRPLSATDLIAEGSKIPHPDDRKAFEEKLKAFAMVHPGEAANVWNQMEKDSQWPNRGYGLVEGMTASNPAKAFQWAAGSAPDHLDQVFASWLKTDGPAAIEAALALPPDHNLRQALVRLANGSYFGPPIMTPENWRTDSGTYEVRQLMNHSSSSDPSEVLIQHAAPLVREALQHVNLPVGGPR